MTVTVQDLISSVRSKNAGPFTVTIDLFFPDIDTYRRVVDSGAITPARVARLYGLAEQDVRVFPFAPALAVKISMPREVAGGDPADTDVSGGQQFVPMLGVEV
jgi:hypothetical protein